MKKKSFKVLLLILIIIFSFSIFQSCTPTVEEEDHILMSIDLKTILPILDLQEYDIEITVSDEVKKVVFLSEEGEINPSIINIQQNRTISEILTIEYDVNDILVIAKCQQNDGLQTINKSLDEIKNVNTANTYSDKDGIYIYNEEEGKWEFYSIKYIKSLSLIERIMLLLNIRTNEKEVIIVIEEKVINWEDYEEDPYEPKENEDKEIPPSENIIDVSYYYVEEISKIDDIEVDFGTTKQNVLTILPKTLKADAEKIYNEEKTEVDLNIEWKNDDYNGTIEGEYEFFYELSSDNDKIIISETIVSGSIFVTVLSDPNPDIPRYTLDLDSNPSQGGSLSGAGSYVEGQHVLINATANPGYAFVDWTDGDTVISSEEEFTYVMPNQNKTLTANFEIIDYTLNLEANPETGGTVGGAEAETYNYNDNIQLTATANPGYAFVNWTDGDTVISTDGEFTYVMPADNKTLIANFEESSEKQWKVTSLLGNPFEGPFEVSFGGDLEEAGLPQTVQAQLTQVNPSSSSNNIVTLDVIWTEDKNFDNYQPGTYVFEYDLQKQENENIEFEIAESIITGSVNVIVAEQLFSLTLSANPSNGGIVLGEGSFEEGQSFTVSATVNPGFEFVCWTRNGNVVSANLTYTSTMPKQNKTLVANFQEVEVPQDTLALKDLTKGDLSNPNNQYDIKDDRVVFGRWTVVLIKDRIPFLDDVDDFALVLNGEEIDFVWIFGNTYRARFLEALAPNEQYIIYNGIIKPVVE